MFSLLIIFFYERLFAHILQTCFWIYVCGSVHTCISTIKFVYYLSGGPQRARGTIIGNINDIEFGIALLNATITDTESGSRLIKAAISNVPRILGRFFLTVSYVLPPLQKWMFLFYFDWKTKCRLLNLRSCNEETHLHPEPHLLDHCTGSWWCCQWLHPNRRSLQTRDPSGVCLR